MGGWDQWVGIAGGLRGVVKASVCSSENGSA